MKIESITKRKMPGMRYYYNCSIKLTNVLSSNKLIICVLNKTIEIDNQYENKEDLIKYINGLSHGGNNLEIQIMTSCASKIQEIEEIIDYIKELDKYNEDFGRISEEDMIKGYIQK